MDHTVYTYKDGPMRQVFEDLDAKVLVDDKGKAHEVNCDIIHLHTGGEASHMANAVQGLYPTIETVHAPVVSAVRDDYVTARIGVSNQVTRLNRKCSTIYNGIDIDRLEKRSVDLREAQGIPPEAFVIGRLGRVASDKYIEDFMLICKKVQETGLIKDLHVLIVGDEAPTSRGYMARLKIMAASLPLENVHFVPALEMVGDAYEAMDLFLYPSPGESFGLVWFEAMACGVPVVTWENDLTRELLTGAAWLSKPEIKKTADDVVYLKLQEGVRSALIQEAKRTALDFSDKYMAAAYRGVYQAMYDHAYAEEDAAHARA